MGLQVRLLFVSRAYSKRIVGIMRETKNIWECRVSLAPENIKNLKKKWGSDLEFHVQPSRKRFFQDEEFVKVRHQFLLRKVIQIFCISNVGRCFDNK